MCAAITVYIAVHIKLEETSSLKNWNVWNRAVYYVIVEVPFLVLVLLQINNREIIQWFVCSSTCL
jgi:hypothetical protein